MAGSKEGAARAMDALLRTGGSRVQLRVPAPAATGDDAEQLGLAAPAFADLKVGRGMLRKAGSSAMLLVAASGVEKALAANGAASAEAMFAGAVGVVTGGVLYRIEAAEPMNALDGVFGYSLTLAATTS